MKKMPKPSEEFRKCMFADCNRTLSIYNHERYCHLHLYMMSAEEKILSSLHPVYSTAIPEK
jgi:hypothetical protein